MDEKGIYNSEDTKELFFDASEQTVTVAVTKGTMNKSYKYHVIFSKDSSNFQDLTDAGVKKELQSRFYLKSAEGDQTAPWHKHFVEMKVEAEASPKKISFYAGNISPTETSNEFEKKYGSSWNYSDKSGTVLDMKIIVSASGHTWTKLVMDPNYDKSVSYCYYDPKKVEHWTFDAAQKTVRIVSTNDNDYKDAS